MAGKGNLKRGIDDLKRGIERTVEEDLADAGATDAGTHDVNVADRANVVVSGNVGEPGSSHRAAGTQRVRIRQDGDETYEESETIKTSS